MRGQIQERWLINTWISGSIGRLVREERPLFDLNVREEAVSHQLAKYLEINLKRIEGVSGILGGQNISFENLSTDCEYNRSGGANHVAGELKMLDLGEYKTGVPSEDAKIVRPDIVVHQRGINNNNLLVMELKKLGGDKPDYALRKLEAFVTSEKYHYDYGVYFEFRTGKELKETEIIRRVIVMSRFGPTADMTQEVIDGLLGQGQSAGFDDVVETEEITS